jgi:hypothetical protein
VFSSAPPNATAIEICINYQTNTIGTPSAGTVTPTALSTGGPYWNDNGNIGIGTTSPAWNLTVRKDQNSATVLQILNANTGGTSQSIIQLQSGATQYVNYTVSYNGLFNQISSSGITSNYIDFDTQYFRNNSGVNRMIIDSAGALNVVTGPIKVGGNQAVNGPAFSAYNGANQSISNNTYTKLQFPSEEYDTNNNFDNATNYRFTPTVAGYYQISGCFQVATQAEKFVMIYKNGVINKAGNDLIGWLASVSAIVYFNGSTDYVELYGYTGSGASTTTSAGAAFVWFQGVMVRGA